MLLENFLTITSPPIPLRVLLVRTIVAGSRRAHNLGRFPFDQNFRNFRSETEGSGNNNSLLSIGGQVITSKEYEERLKRIGVQCGLWQWHLTEWTYIFIVLLLRLVSIGSLTNITSIALQRLHATFFPFKHRYIIQVCELVCSSQSSKPFELAAAYLQITKGTKETNNNK